MRFVIMVKKVAFTENYNYTFPCYRLHKCNRKNNDEMKILDELYKIIKKRIKEMPANSTVATLVKKGEDRVIQKVGEEAIEVIVAAKGTSKKRIIEEMADLYFMTIIL